MNAAGPSFGAPKKTHIIVIGNEKGGSGKTTTTMHLIVALLRLGFKIGSIDIDSRQRSLSRYIENRKNTMTNHGASLPLPQHFVVQRSPFNVLDEAEADERERLTSALKVLMAENDFIVIDSPGSDTYLSRLAHSYADTIITPINDSFVDLDVLANVDGNTLKIVKPSIYSEMVWEQKLLRAKRDGGSIEWIVMRNRLSNIDARNKRFMTQVLNELARRIGFRAAPGFSERVIFREMFLQGLTVLDVMDTGGSASVSLSHIAARQEVRDLLKTLRIPKVDERVAEMRARETGHEASNSEQPAPVTAEVKPSAPAPTPTPTPVAAKPPVIGGAPVSAEKEALQVSPAAYKAATRPTEPETEAHESMREATNAPMTSAGSAIRSAAAAALRNASGNLPWRSAAEPTTPETPPSKPSLEKAS